MSKSRPMTSKAAARIQSSTARSSNSGGVTKGSFTARAQSAGAKNANK
ncbi:hypothetical protein FG167_16495 [Lacinutrix sp. WUR7]|nr:hypothetical protein [Lacinutrix sp. WUR7]QRM90770.1 hypothetical protein FG167_16495 [Lacinutrix sp. WUR7]